MATTLMTSVKSIMEWIEGTEYIDQEDQIMKEKAINRLKIVKEQQDGALPKYVKVKHVHDYWLCSNCGSIIKEVHHKYCHGCGYFLTTRFPNYNNEVK